MTKEKIFEDRREVPEKICQDIRANNGLMLNAKYFSERPYCAGVKPYKFSTANYLRLISSDNETIRKSGSHWFPATEIKSNDWTLKENAVPVFLEVWTKDAEQQCSLTEFYNASDILEKESFQQKSQSLETVLNFLKERKILEVDDKIISFLPFFSETVLAEIEKSPDIHLK